MNTPSVWKVLKHMKKDQLTGTWKVQVLKISHRTPPLMTLYLLHFKFHRLPDHYNSKSLNIFSFHYVPILQKTLILCNVNSLFNVKFVCCYAPYTLLLLYYI